MVQQYDIKTMAARITALRRDAEALRDMSNGIPTIDCNINRLLACVKMLEININDVAAVLDE